MNRGIRSGLALSLILGLFTTSPNAYADALEPCRVKASANLDVSLGFPLRPERLAFIAKPKILVIPFKLKDTPDYIFTDEYKSDYKAAAANIKELSQGKASVEFIFAPTVSTELTLDDMTRFRNGQGSASEENSTRGFIRKFIADHDSKIDFTGINGVMLEGSSTRENSSIAEAMMYSLTQSNSLYRPIQTAEGRIDNVILYDKHWPAITITHETMHLYGLTDSTGPTGANGFTLMSSTQMNLLAYEKWILGWYPNSEVKCFDKISNSSVTEITLDYSKANQLAVIRAQSGSVYIVETAVVKGDKYLAYYALKINEQNSLTFYPEFIFNGNGIPGPFIGTYHSIGTQLKSPEFALIISDQSSSTITLNLVSTSLSSAPQYSDLVSKASEALLKRKQEAEAKTTSVVKKTTITCIKGKTTKKVTATNPTCPKGYKKK
jgi:hypothetical protein